MATTAVIDNAPCHHRKRTRSIYIFAKERATKGCAGSLFLAYACCARTLGVRLGGGGAGCALDQFLLRVAADAVLGHGVRIRVNASNVSRRAGVPD